MSELLTLQEYQAIAADLDFPGNCFINGGFKASKSGKTFSSTNPANGEKLTNISRCDSDDVDYAVEKARNAFDGGMWRTMHPSDRKDILIRFCKLITRNRRELAVMESLDSGKPIRDCVEIDLPETIHTIKWHAETIDKLYDQTAPSGDDALAIIVREPVGVVGCVLPWNFPMLMMAWKIAPALAAGNSVIVKPAEQTSLTALRLAELASEAGLPDGVLNVVTGFGEEVGKPMGLHPDIDMISFTGSTDTGALFLNYSAASNLKKIVLECGGKNPCVVFEDAENLDKVASHVVNAAFWNMGENCSAASRLIVHKNIKPKLIERIIENCKLWRTGNPLDPVNQLGSMIDKNHYDKVCGYLKKGSEQGASIIFGGETLDGAYIKPTLFDSVDESNAIYKEEIFGPVLAICEANSFEQAIKMANDSEYGLAASVFTANLKTALRASRSIKAGTVSVNCYGEGDISTPFGGYKKSGFGGRDNSIHAHDQYTELKTIWIDLSDDQSDCYLD